MKENTRKHEKTGEVKKVPDSLSAQKLCFTFLGKIFKGNICCHQLYVLVVMLYTTCMYLVGMIVILHNKIVLHGLKLLGYILQHKKISERKIITTNNYWSVFFLNLQCQLFYSVFVITIIMSKININFSWSNTIQLLCYLPLGHAQSHFTSTDSSQIIVNASVFWNIQLNSDYCPSTNSDCLTPISPSQNLVTRSQNLFCHVQNLVIHWDSGSEITPVTIWIYWSLVRIYWLI